MQLFFLTTVLAISPYALAARMRRSERLVDSHDGVKAVGVKAVGSGSGVRHAGGSVGSTNGTKVTGSGSGVSIGNSNVVARASNTGAGSGADIAKDSGQSGAKAALSAMVEQMIEGKGPMVREILRTAGNSLSTEEAERQVEGTLPAEVATLMHLNQDQAPSEEDLQRARRILNTMMRDAWMELDSVIFECKEFQEHNRGAYQQVVADLSRLGANLASLGEQRVNAGGGVAKYSAERKKMEDTIMRTDHAHNAKKVKDRQLLQRYQNDIAVFNFMLNHTTCSNLPSPSSDMLSLCQTDDSLLLNFSNPRLQAQVEKQLTPDARTELRRAMGQLSGLQQAVTIDHGVANGTAQRSSLALTEQHGQLDPLAENLRKCTYGSRNCAFIYDLMSLAWGRFQDAFDSLRQEIRRNQADHDVQLKNLNEQLTVIGDAKTRFMESLAETVSRINADTEEMTAKEKQKRDLSHEYDTKCRSFRLRITDIMYSKLCVVRKVRNALMSRSAITPPSNITDCDVSDWTAATGDCMGPNNEAILCDDRCPQADPNQCGGTEELKRAIVVMPNANGVSCPPTTHLKRCAQKKCAVSCVLSDWTGWSKCTKACEGGVQTKTRTMLVKPQFGGQLCDVMQEERACNTGSCDHDCVLGEWTDWGRCSMSCGGGRSVRHRNVLSPIRGRGKCPKTTAAERRGEEECNTHQCRGDEVCAQQQDLIIALDASGSVTESGFSIMREFAVELTKRFKAQMFGLETVRIGVILFGNGHVTPHADGGNIVSPALEVLQLTSDLDLVRQKIGEQTWQHGITNLAQALSLADGLLVSGGRQEAQSVVLVITDGKNPFEFQTAQKARALQDRNVKVAVAAFSNLKDSHYQNMQSWVSMPWKTNMLMIPGVHTLAENMDIFISRAVTRFCSDSISLNVTRQMELGRNFMLVHENGWPADTCADWKPIGAAKNLEDCASLVASKGFIAFAYGRDKAENQCYSGQAAMPKDYWELYFRDRANPPCPGSSPDWDFNPFFNTYVMRSPRIRLESNLTNTGTVADEQK